jgi:hypothetical protein
MSASSTELVDSWEYRMKVTEANYEEEIQPLYKNLLLTVFNFLGSNKYKELV